MRVYEPDGEPPAGFEPVAPTPGGRLPPADQGQGPAVARARRRRQAEADAAIAGGRGPAETGAAIEPASPLPDRLRDATSPSRPPAAVLDLGRCSWS